MDSSIRVNYTTNMDAVREILLIPEVWERAAEENIDPQSYYPGYDDLNAWLVVMEDDKAIGVILVSRETQIAVRMHPYMLPEHMTKGREMMKAFYKWFMNTGFQKVNVTIPMTDKKLYNFAKKVGFEDEGVNRQSYLRDNETFDQWNLGATKQEIGERL